MPYTLVFSEAKSECNECHTDVHQATTGLDCARCHTPNSWLVSNITGIHQTSRFPLLGAHRTADCSDCHKSETLVRFDVPGVNCIDCHRENYMATTNPNHSESGFSEDCSPCHPVNSFEWTGAGFNHAFFPLTQGHSGLNCSECHTTGSYTDALIRIVLHAIRLTIITQPIRTISQWVSQQPVPHAIL